jgi:hypothetical protein
MAERSRRLCGLLLVGSALALGGCYTLLQHPAEAGKPVDVRSDALCARCHDDDDPPVSDLYPWLEYYSYSTSPWMNYYGTPWWVDSRWEWSAPEDSTGNRPLAGRLGWGRRPRTIENGDSVRIRENPIPPAPVVSAPPVAPPPVISLPAGADTSRPKPTDVDKKKTATPRKRSLRR